MASDGVRSVDATTAFERARPLLGAGRLLLASDFDGTLSHLVADPWSARMLPGARRSLRRLAGTAGLRVALISGRTVADLATRARVGGVSYRGDHGSERAEAPRGFRPSALQVEREAAPPDVVEVAGRLKTGVPAQVDAPWLVLEDKDTSLTFHFRAAPDVDEAGRRVRAAVERIDREHLLERVAYRRSVELRPPGASTKGSALAALVDELAPAGVVMLGDDRNDALAFDAVRRLRADGRVDGLAIAVAGHPDVTREVAPRADLLLASPDETAALLRLLVTATSDRR